jgi:hypothetical protein
MRQSARALASDQGIERFENQSRLFLDAGKRLSARDKFVVEGEGGAHGRPPSFLRHEYSIE